MVINAHICARCTYHFVLLHISALVSHRLKYMRARTLCGAVVETITFFEYVALSISLLASEIVDYEIFKREEMNVVGVMYLVFRMWWTLLNKRG